MSAKEKSVQAIVRVLPSSCIRSLFGKCIEFSFDKKTLLNKLPEIHSTFDFIGDIASFLKSSSKRNVRLTTAI